MLLNALLNFVLTLIYCCFWWVNNALIHFSVLSLVVLAYEGVSFSMTIFFRSNCKCWRMFFSLIQAGSQLWSCEGLLNWVLYEALPAGPSISLILLFKVLIFQGSKPILRCWATLTFTGRKLPLQTLCRPQAGPLCYSWGLLGESCAGFSLPLWGMVLPGSLHKHLLEAENNAVKVCVKQCSKPEHSCRLTLTCVTLHCCKWLGKNQHITASSEAISRKMHEITQRFVKQPMASGSELSLQLSPTQQSLRSLLLSLVWSKTHREECSYVVRQARRVKDLCCAWNSEYYKKWFLTWVHK